MSEVLTVTLLARRGWAPVLAGLGYWLTVGIPVLIVGVGRLLGHDATEITLAAAGQSLSGLLNVVLAELLAGLPGPIQRLRSQAGTREPKPLRTQLFHQLVPLAAIPLALLGLGLGGLFARAAERGASAELAERVRLVGHRVGDIVAEQESALQARPPAAWRTTPSDQPLAARGALALAQEQRLRPRFASLAADRPRRPHAWPRPGGGRRRRVRGRPFARPVPRGRSSGRRRRGDPSRRRVRRRARRALRRPGRAQPHARSAPAWSSIRGSRTIR